MGVRNSSDGEQERCLGKVRGGRTQSRDGDYSKEVWMQAK